MAYLFGVTHPIAQKYLKCRKKKSQNHDWATEIGSHVGVYLKD